MAAFGLHLEKRQEGPPEAHPKMAQAMRHRGEIVQNIGLVFLLEKETQSDPNYTYHSDENRHLLVTERLDLPNDILKQFANDPAAALQTIDGPGVRIFWDDDILIIARDGPGARAVNYGWHAGQFACASETKAVLTVPGMPRELRREGLIQYLAYSFIPGPGTLLKGVFSLPAGCFLKVDRRDPGRPVEPIRYEDLTQIEKVDEPLEKWAPRFRSTMSEVVRQQLAQVKGKPGLFLSGGLDSTCVAAELQSQGAEVTAYALHFGEGYPHELDFAREAAAFSGLNDFQEIEIRPSQFLDRFEDFVWHLDEPVGDPVALPNYELARQVGGAHQDIFNGEGGDPCFGGPKNQHLLLHHWYGRPEHREDPHHREKAYLASYRRAYEEASRLLRPDFCDGIDLNEALEAPLHPFLRSDDSAPFLDKLMRANQRLKGAHLIEPKVERMLGAHGLRPRSPLFSEAVVRDSFAMPARHKLRYGREKVILKEAYRGLVPDSIIDRPKSGMRVPVHYWMKGEMKRMARDLLSTRSLKRQGVFDPRRVQQLIRYQTDEGPGRYGLRLWMLVTLQLWLRQFLNDQ